MMICMTAPPYAGLRLDREPPPHADQHWPERALHAPTTMVVPMRDGACFLRDGELVTDAPAERATWFLGRLGERAVFVADLPAESGDETAADAVDTRVAYPSLSRDEAALVNHARALCHWHATAAHCPTCGAPTTPAGWGSHRTCDGCGRLLFPRLEPAVMALITAPADQAHPQERILLVQHAGAAGDRLALVAGFVEVGESLEDAVVREVAEEVGLEVARCRYLGSQPWPFPAGLMIAFRAEVRDAPPQPTDGEIVATRWFTAAELRDRAEHHSLGPPDSLNRWLLTSWLAEQGHA